MTVRAREATTIVAIFFLILFISINYIHDDTLRVTATRCKNEGRFVVDSHVYTCGVQR